MCSPHRPVALQGANQFATAFTRCSEWTCQNNCHICACHILTVIYVPYSLGSGTGPSTCREAGGNSNYHGARPVHLIITMIKWIRTSRLSIKNSLSGGEGGSIAGIGAIAPPQLWTIGADAPPHQGGGLPWDQDQPTARTKTNPHPKPQRPKYHPQGPHRQGERGGADGV